MDKNRRFKNFIAILLNLFIIIATIYSIIDVVIAVEGFGVGTSCFIYFTIDSNIFMSVCALIAIIYIIKNKTTTYPKWLSLLKFSATSAVMLTCITVMGFLGIIYGYKMMLDGGNLFMHLVTPLVALLTLVLFENEPRFKFKYSLLGVVPTLVYGTVYVICVFAIKCWIDFYQFNLNGYWYLILPGMILLSTIISIATYFLRKLTSNNKA